MKRAVISALLLFTAIAASAQEDHGLEMGIGAVYGLNMSYGMDLTGGYRFSEHFSGGIGIEYLSFMNAVNTHVFRQYLYGRFYLLPSSTWTPYAGLRLGYSLYTGLGLNNALTSGPVTASKGRSQGKKADIYTALDMGVSRMIGKKGGRVSVGLLWDNSGSILSQYQ